MAKKVHSVNTQGYTRGSARAWVNHWQGEIVACQQRLERAGMDATLEAAELDERRALVAALVERVEAARWDVASALELARELETQRSARLELWQRHQQQDSAARAALQRIPGTCEVATCGARLYCQAARVEGLAAAGAALADLEREQGAALERSSAALREVADEASGWPGWLLEREALRMALEHVRALPAGAAPGEVLERLRLELDDTLNFVWQHIEIRRRLVDARIELEKASALLGDQDKSEDK